LLNTGSNLRSERISSVGNVSWMGVSVPVPKMHKTGTSLKEKKGKMVEMIDRVRFMRL